MPSWPSPSSSNPSPLDGQTWAVVNDITRVGAAPSRSTRSFAGCEKLSRSVAPSMLIASRFASRSMAHITSYSTSSSTVSPRRRPSARGYATCGVAWSGQLDPTGADRRGGGEQGVLRVSPSSQATSTHTPSRHPVCLLGARRVSNPTGSDSSSPPITRATRSQDRR